VLDPLVAARPADRIAETPSIVDLREPLSLRNVQDNAKLWFGEGDEVVGFALVDQYDNLRFEIARQVACSSIESEIVGWGVEFIGRAARQENGKHRAAFGTEYLTVEERLATMREPEYDPELDLLAVAPDGRLAAYCMCFIRWRHIPPLTWVWLDDILDGEQR
jgi:hypothetical protein